jgi:hypothetical protein
MSGFILGPASAVEFLCPPAYSKIAKGYYSKRSILQDFPPSVHEICPLPSYRAPLKRVPQKSCIYCLFGQAFPPIGGIYIACLLGRIEPPPPALKRGLLCRACIVCIIYSNKALRPPPLPNALPLSYLLGHPTRPIARVFRN